MEHKMNHLIDHVPILILSSQAERKHSIADNTARKLVFGLVGLGMLRTDIIISPNLPLAAISYQGRSTNLRYRLLFRFVRL